MKTCIFLSVLIAAAVGFLSCSDGDGVPHGSGMIEATEVVISAEAAGRLERLYFDEGSKIDRGDTIAIIDTTAIVLRRRQAAATYEALVAGQDNAAIRVEQAASNDSLARKELERISRLLKSGSANQQEYDRTLNAHDQAHLAYKAAQVSLRAAEAETARIKAEIALLDEQYADCQPLSPLTGTVVTTYVEEGELLSPGKPILKIARLDTVWVKIYIPPHDLARIKLGDQAEVDPEDGREKLLSGTITWIADRAEFTPKNVQTKEARADLVYAVKITISNESEILKIGMPVSVRIP